MNHPKIAFDESGNTGSDLLDKQQPVFILASVNLNENEAKSLLKIFSSQAEELKFNRLKKYSRSQHEIIEFLNHELISDKKIKIAVTHKEYCIWLHTIDRLVEPLAHMDGIDFYEKGANISFTNLLHYYIPVVCSKELCEQYKIDFINLFKQKDDKSITQFYNTLEKMIASCKVQDFKNVLYTILRSREIIKEILDDWDHYNYDATLTSFINIVDYWGRMNRDGFDAIVDDSKPLKHFDHLIERVRKISLQKELGTDRRTLEFPLKIKGLRFADSKENPNVQIADLLAGAANHYFRSIANPSYMDKLAKQISESKFSDLHHFRIWPRQAFTPQELGTDGPGGKSLLDSIVDEL